MAGRGGRVVCRWLGIYGHVSVRCRHRVLGWTGPIAAFLVSADIVHRYLRVGPGSGRSFLGDHRSEAATSNGSAGGLSLMSCVKGVKHY